MTIDSGLMKRYLLGTASPEERNVLENKYLSDTDSFEELTAAENDLIDFYTQGKLSDTDKREFEKQYLSSLKRKARVDFSLALGELSAQPHPPASVGKFPFSERLLSLFRSDAPSFQWARTALFAVTLVLIGVSLLKHNQSGPLFHQPMALQEVSPAQTPLGEFTLTLNPGVSRAGGSNTDQHFVAPVGTSLLNIQLHVEDDDYPRYAVVIKTTEGARIRRIEGLYTRIVAGNKVLAVWVPVSVIPAGDYIVDLRAKAQQSTEVTVESYSFHLAYQ